MKLKTNKPQIVNDSSIFTLKNNKEILFNSDKLENKSKLKFTFANNYNHIFENNTYIFVPSIIVETLNNFDWK